MLELRAAARFRLSPDEFEWLDPHKAAELLAADYILSAIEERRFAALARVGV